MIYLELRRIDVVAARLTKVTEDKLWEEGQIESDECDHGCEFACQFRIQAPRNFWPPIVKASHERHHHAAHHDVVKMSDDEICVVHVNIDRERGEKQPGYATDGKKANETQRVEHWCREMNGAFA